VIKFRKRLAFGADQTHLYWAILLLVVAVVLPTACLLFFLNQAVRNERLAVRQKLIDIYSSRADSLLVEHSANFPAYDKKLLSDSASLSPAEFFETFADTGKSPWQGMVIYNKDGKLTFPVLSAEDEIYDSSPVLKKAWQMEFVDKDFAKAAAAYAQIADAGNEGLWGPAMVAKIRCLQKAGKAAEAADACQKLAWPEQKRDRQDRFIANARLMQINLFQAVSPPDFPRACEKLLENRFADLSIDSPTKIFLLRQCITITETAGLAAQLADKISRTKKTLAAEEISVHAAQLFPSASSFNGWPEGTFRSIAGSPKMYGINFAAGDRFILALVNGEKMSAFWTKAVEDINDRTIFCSVVDDTGRVAAGVQEIRTRGAGSFGERFLSRILSEPFLGWKVDLYFKDSPFTAAARRQQTVYFWTFALVIGSMVAVSGLLARLILHQARLNKLKNDFLATVTHELKTPLSSMRVLVDTLLDGRVTDAKQAEEYLVLVSKENERLSRLIDNFLTFSRMERNKQAFEITQTRPADIAKAAAEAVRTKFDKTNCKFTLTIDESAAGGLPAVSADKDALVTVLVNLLDNAYKYSYDDKQIEMKVFTGSGSVCFSVKDNGIGMSRRVVKKIFNKFYQADNSLSRRAGGCGLGLSIVKFIVDAHKGSITVESEPGKGSTFIVKILAGA
jgi:signal transduction histidine kinase